ncbi:hypothetical protein FRACA_50056 [Frankia canadensis]|uniref:Uncharacterized protein n=1 Tax=Frankia canadensis TaxID=1836972 RepID=A0A2I2KYD2_9ACTN|nr:hypothetical protein FRACA_50056 [Frankia canadensis]SOU57958.1 hypothetical protein FRACA_50056 [Frankia canadensis]
MRGETRAVGLDYKAHVAETRDTTGVYWYGAVDDAVTRPMGGRGSFACIVVTVIGRSDRPRRRHLLAAG